MHDEVTVQRFIELRAQGRTYAQLMTELGVSKPTLIAWSRKHQFQIQNLRAVELEALADHWLTSVTERVQTLGRQLQQIEGELATRAVKDLSTAQLFTLARSLRHQIGELTGRLRFASPVSELPSDEYHDQIHDWHG